MRSETERFSCNEFDVDDLFAVNMDDSVRVIIRSDEGYIQLTKQQAAEFARQILEMCGEE